MTLLMPNPQEQALAATGAEQLNKLDSIVESAELSIVVNGEVRSFPVPATVLQMLGEVMLHLAQGNAVTVAPVHLELTTQEAAEILGVSRPYLVKLLEGGEIPFRRPHKHRRVRLQDVLDYKGKQDALRMKALDELAQLSQDMGLYD